MSADRIHFIDTTGKPSKASMLSPTQRGLLADSLVATDRGVNVEQILCELDERCNPDAMRSAWESVVHEFDALRLQFERAGDGEFVQFCPDVSDLRFRCLDWSKREDHIAEQDLEVFVEQDRRSGFELLSSPLLRVAVLQLPRGRTVVLWTIHHAIIDGPSYPMVLGRVLSSYRRIVAGQPTEAVRHPPFLGFLDWLSRHDETSGVGYFRSVLRGITEPTPLPLATPGRLALQRSGEIASVLKSGDTGALHAAAAAAEVSVNTILQLAWGLLIGRHTGRDDVVFGATWSGRQGTLPLADQTVGPFINTLPVRVDVSGGGSVQGALSALRTQHVESRPFQQTSLASIKSEIGYSGARHLFGTIVVFEREKPLAHLEREPIDGVRARFRNRSQTGYALSLAAHVREGELVLQLEFDTGLYEVGQVEQLLDGLKRLICAIPGALDRDIHDLPLLAPALHSKLTTVEAERETVPDQPPVLAQIFARADQRFDACAVVDLFGRSISYRELLGATTRVAESLKRAGVGDEDIVAILLPRSIEAVVAQLAVQRSGAAFLMLDRDYPEERLRYMLADSGSRWLLVSSQTMDVLGNPGCQMLDIEGLSSPPSAEANPAVPSLARHLDGPPSCDRLAYVIYTSGSTGEPKGVRISERSLANHVAATRELYRLEPSDRVLQFFAQSFDASLEEIFPTLAAGATLVLRDELMASSASAFFDAIEAHRLTVLNIPTAFWHQLVQLRKRRDWPACVRLLIVGGERVSPTVHAKFREGATDHIRWLNCYGPTEATITSTAYDDRMGDHSSEYLPIGVPLNGHSHFVLDHRLRPVPPGVTGQLYVGGVGLALGYHGRPEITEERFVPHPWRSGARLYATGDLVWRTPQGNHVYAGRIDHQVKVRGFRIELGEIEVRLQQHPEVKEVVAVVQERPGSSPRLVAFVESDADIAPLALRTFAAATLPAYMVPDHLVVCRTLPTTAAGKIDRKALESLSPSRPQSALGPESDADPLDLALMKIWRQVLEVPVLDPFANFFEAGGNSMLVLNLFAEIERRFEKTLNPTVFFERPTLAHLADMIRQSNRVENNSLVVGLAAGSSRIRPLFFTPGVTGRGVDYVHLARSIHPDVPLYAIHMPGLGGGNDRYGDTGTLATDFADAIQAVQPVGPYALAGFSAGCIVAVAISEVLLKRGEGVDFVGLIDGTPPAAIRFPSPFSSPRRFARLVRTVVDRIREILGQPGWMHVLWLRGRFAMRRVASSWIPESKKYELSVDDLFASDGVRFAEADRQVMQSRLSMLMAYDPKAIPIDVALFRVASDPFEGPHEPDLGWSRLISGKVSIEIISGSHRDILSATGAPALAHLISRHLAARIP